jgi:DNA-binding CsgD family transcriptional regulator/DNA-binding transcriptional regulator YhcF (GntR family)
MRLGRLTVLTVLGASEAEEAVYRELIGTASATAAELAETLHLPPDAVRAALSALERRGLVTRTITQPPRFVAAPPDTVAEGLLLRRQAELAKARAELEELARAYRSGRRTRNTDELIEIVIGAEPLAHRVSHLTRSPRREFAGFVKPPFVAVDLDRAEPLADPDVSYRAVYDQEILRRYPGLLGKLQANTAPRVEYRIHPSLPMKLMIADRETALLPLGRDTGDVTPAAVIVHSSGLLDALLALFDQYWEASIPLVALDAENPDRAEGGLTGADRRILSLLVAGVTDEAIAGQLGVSLRTVRRRIQEMMRAANARNRAQLGWRAARDGWL